MSLTSSIRVALGACALTAALAGTAQASDCAICPPEKLAPVLEVSRGPDLVVSSFSMFHHVTVKNIGTMGAGPSYVRTYASGFGYRSYRVGSLAPGAAQTIALPDMTWCTYGGQTLDAVARADAYDAVPEASEINNRRESKLIC